MEEHEDAYYDHHKNILYLEHTSFGIESSCHKKDMGNVVFIKYLMKSLTYW